MENMLPENFLILTFGCFIGGIGWYVDFGLVVWLAAMINFQYRGETDGIYDRINYCYNNDNMALLRIIHAWTLLRRVAPQ